MTIRFDNIFFIPFYLMINMFSTFPTFSARLSLIWPCRTCDSKLSTGEIAWQPNVSSQGNNQKMYPIRNVFIITTVLGDRVIWKRNINDIVQYLGVLKMIWEYLFFRHREKVLTDLVRIIICSFQTPRENELKGL